MAIINGVGRVGIRSYVAPAPTSSYLLDTYGGASTAYSLRKLSSTYTGSAIRVRRSSDNTEQNIGFDASGNLDTTSLLAFVGAGNGFVTTWYDQSGNAQNMIQTIASNQPKIVISGAINMTGSKPSIRFQNSGLYNTQPSFNAPISIFSIINNNPTSGNNYFIYSNTMDSSYGSTIGLVNGTWRIQNSTATSITTYGIYSDVIYGNNLISTVMAPNSTWDLFKNNTSLFSDSVTAGPFTLNALGYRSNPGGTFYSDYDLRETIVYPSDQRNNRTNINANINSYYSIYPTYTTRTQAFAAATGIADTTILNALNTFDTGLISNGLDTKMKALYPFVGGTAVTHKFNFMDARDLDAAFRLTFNGGWVHDSNGAKGNGVNTYGNTYFKPSDSTYTNFSWGYYLRTNTIGDFGEFGLHHYSTGAIVYDYPNADGNRYVRYNSGDKASTGGNTIGFYSINQNSNQLKLFKGGVLTTTHINTPIDASVAPIPYYIGARNDNNAGSAYPSNRSRSLQYIADGLTDTESTTFYNLVQAMQTSLGRAL